MVCFAGVAVFGAIQGVALAIVIAVIEFLWDAGVPILPCWAGSNTSEVSTTSPAIPRGS